LKVNHAGGNGAEWHRFDVCNHLCALMELGFSQFRQVLWSIFGLITGPLAMLWLYVRLRQMAPDQGEAVVLE
jgi:hypothetical protein